MIRSLFERATRAIERVLALAFIAAVVLNFTNVIGRYGFGRSIQGADEVQMFILVCMAFLGAVVASWRGQHLRMDVLVQYFPKWMQSFLRVAEFALVAALTGFVLLQSARYSWQMFVLQRKSDDAGIPMWIPHGAVTLGFGLIALIAAWHAIRYARGGAGADSDPGGPES